jgi:CDP-6-deoxy-D-xylo-4-hexulose-3-dehydrase
VRVLYAQANYGQEEVDAALEVLTEHPLGLMTGPKVSEFEARVATLFGKSHGVMVNSGSSANLLAVRALRLAEGSEVITPALTFSTTVAPLVQSGLVPAFVDVESDTLNIDAEQVEALIGPKTRALMVPNLIGNLPDWSRLRALADQHGLIVIEDSADTIGTLYDGSATGGLTDISTTSFYASHVVTCAGFGGMLCASEFEVIERARLLRGWGRSSSLVGESEQPEDRFGIEVDGIPYDAKFVFEELGYNFLPSEVAAAFGLVQLERLGDFIERRIVNFASLLGFFQEFDEWFTLPRQNARAQTAWLAFPLVVSESAPFDRRSLQQHLEADGIQTRTVFSGNILRQPGFRSIPRREMDAGYPHADAVMRGGILLGCHQSLTEEHLDHIRASFRTFVNGLAPT